MYVGALTMAANTTEVQTVMAMGWADPDLIVCACNSKLMIARPVTNQFLTKCQTS